jgi:hypothetical protein
VISRNVKGFQNARSDFFAPEFLGNVKRIFWSSRQLEVLEIAVTSSAVVENFWGIQGHGF